MYLWHNAKCIKKCKHLEYKFPSFQILNQLLCLDYPNTKVFVLAHQWSLRVASSGAGGPCKARIQKRSHLGLQPFEQTFQMIFFNVLYVQTKLFNFTAKTTNPLLTKFKIHKTISSSTKTLTFSAFYITHSLLLAKKT